MRLRFARLIAATMMVGQLSSSSAAQDLDAIQLCEQLVTARLKAPAGYQRIKADESIKRMSIGEWWAHAISSTSNYTDDQQRRAKVKELERQFSDMQKAGAEPALYTVKITFDAPNSFNAPIRSAARCSHLSPTGALDGLNASSMDLWFE